MIRVTQVGEDGAEVAAIELDEFTVEILYSGIASLLRGAASVTSAVAPVGELSPQARQRRSRIMERLRD